MVIEMALGILTEAIIDAVVSTATDRASDKLISVLKGDVSKKAFKQALEFAINDYATSASGQKELLVAPLTEKHGFLTQPSIVKQLAKLLMFKDPPSAELVGESWKASFEYPPIYINFTEEAQLLLSCIKSKLQESEVFRPVFEAKSLDSIAANTSLSTEKLTEVVTKLDSIYELAQEQKKGEIHYLYVDLKAPARKERDLLISVVNVNLEYTDSRGRTNEIPFVPFKGYSEISSDDNLYVVGPHFSGKSRFIYEILTKKISVLDGLYIVGSELRLRNIISILDHPQSVSSTSIDEFMERIDNHRTSNIILIWDNFPDGLSNSQNLENVQQILERLMSQQFCNGQSSKYELRTSEKEAWQQKQCLIILNPDHLEKLKNIAANITGLRRLVITYGEKEMREFLEAFGQLPSLSEVYKKGVEPELQYISEKLFRKLPLPLLVKFYYDELLKNEDMDEDPRKIADNMPNSDEVERYIKKQLYMIRSDPTRRADLYFLYTLKFAFIFGEGNTYGAIQKLQCNIFRMGPPANLIHNLGNWIYMHQGKCLIHDLFRENLEFDQDAFVLIFAYIESDMKGFIKGILSRPVNKSELGNFFASTDYYSFEELFHCIVELYSEKEDLNVILSRHEFYDSSLDNFTEALGKGLINFITMSRENQHEVIKYIEDKNMIKKAFSIHVSQAIGEAFILARKHERKYVLELASQGQFFLYGFLAAGVFSSLSRQERKHILELVSKGEGFARSLGRIFGNGCNLSNEDIQDLHKLAETNRYFAFSCGVEVGQRYPFIFAPIIASPTKEDRQVFLDLARNNTGFAVGFGYGFGEIIFGHVLSLRYLLKEELQEDRQVFLDLARKNYSFVLGTIAKIKDYYSLHPLERAEAITPYDDYSYCNYVEQEWFRTFCSAVYEHYKRIEPNIPQVLRLKQDEISFLLRFSLSFLFLLLLAGINASLVMPVSV
jgi:hypothetical protein